MPSGGVWPGVFSGPPPQTSYCAPHFPSLPRWGLRRKDPAGTRCLCNVRLTLDMTSDRRCILAEYENCVDVNIWRWRNVGFCLNNLKTTKSQCQQTFVFDINLTLTLDVEFTLDFGHPASKIIAGKSLWKYNYIFLKMFFLTSGLVLMSCITVAFCKTTSFKTL